MSRFSAIFSFLALATIGWVTSAQAQSTAFTSALVTHEAEQIFPASQDQILIQSKGQIEVLSTASGLPLSVKRFETSLVNAVPMASRTSRAMQLLLLTEQLGGRHDLLVLRNFGDEPLEIKPSEVDALPDDIESPAILPIGDGREVVAWSRDLTSYQTGYALLDERSWRRISTKLVPYDLLGVGSDQLVMGLHPMESQVSLLNLHTGDIEDLIFVPSIGAEDPASLATFAPGATLGGTGAVLIANQSLSRLTLLSIGASTFPRLSTAAVIGIPTHGEGEPLLAATDDLSAIVTSSVGSTALDVFQASDRALRFVGSVDLGFEIKDLIVLPLAPTGHHTFAILGADGRKLSTIASDDLLGEVQEAVQIVVAHADAPELTAGDIAGTQRLLAYLGYSVGALDGMYGPATSAAVRAFQFDRGIETSGTVDAPTLDRLNEALGTVVASGKSLPERANEYGEYMATRVPGVDISDLLYLGGPHQDPLSRCFGLNTLPPDLLWENSIPLARLLDELKRDFQVGIEVASSYRNPVYDSCVGAQPSSSHLSFSAIDLVPTPNDRAAVLEALQELNQSDRFDIRIGDENAGFIHVDLVTRALERPTVFLQFAGGTRSNAQELARLLTLEGFVLPGEERLGTAAGQREVRYYRPEDKSKAEELAASTMRSLRSMGYPLEHPIDVVSLEGTAGTDLPENTLELWLEL